MRNFINLIAETVETPAQTVVRLFRSTAPAGNCHVDLGAAGEDSVELHSIAVYDRGKGIGNRVLGFLTDLADEHRVSIILEAGPQYDTEGEGEVLDGSALVAWYASHGFDWHESGGCMARPPSDPRPDPDLA
jgi:hypothetical protein